MVIMTNKGKFKLCGPCAFRKTKCSIIQDLSNIIDYKGNVVHPAKSWPQLISCPQKDGQQGIQPNSKAKEKSNAKTKGKQKAKNKDKDNIEGDIEWVGKVNERKPSKTKSKSNKDKPKAQMKDEEEPSEDKWVSEDIAETVGNMDLWSQKLLTQLLY
jgi:hypothetical protein